MEPSIDLIERWLQISSKDGAQISNSTQILDDFAHKLTHYTGSSFTFVYILAVIHSVYLNRQVIPNTFEKEKKKKFLCRLIA